MKFSKLRRNQSGDEENQSDLVSISLFEMGSESSSSPGKKSKNRRFAPLSSDSSHAMELDDGSDIVFREEPSSCSCSGFYENKPRTFGGMIVCLVFVLPLFIAVICLGVVLSKRSGGVSDYVTVTNTTTVSPSLWPTAIPSTAPSIEPSAVPSAAPTIAPSVEPSALPSAVPSATPTIVPTAYPTVSFAQYSVTSTKGAVATDTSQCSSIGASILDRGGNAVDAAVASTFCVGVLSPASSGIGGGCYILIHNSTTGQSTFIDSREVAPSAANWTMFESNPMLAQYGGLAVAVLGEVRGLHTAWSLYGSGKISWSDLVTPAAALAAEWTISQEVANIIASMPGQFVEDSAPDIPGLYDPFYALFQRADGTLKTVGDVVNQPQLSATLYGIAEHGPDYLYQNLSSVLAGEIQALGGVVTAEDIQAYQPALAEPVVTSVFGHTYVGAGGSSSGGGVVAGLLKFMASFGQPLASLGNLYYHRLVEGYKHCFAIRLSLGDPAYVNTTAPMDALLSDSYMGALAGETSDSSVLGLYSYGGKFNIDYANSEDHGTTHLSVIDSQGNAVGITSTINTYFGSMVFSNATGIILNNQMDDFSIPGVSNSFGLAPSPLNYPEPQKRPLSSMSPSILINSQGKVRLIGGASGGPRIITATAQVILNYLGKGMDLLSALIAPRVHSQLLPDKVDVEHCSLKTGLNITADVSIVDSLIERHHNNVSYYTKSMGVTQFIAVDPDTGIMQAVSDPRKYGTPAAATTTTTTGGSST